MVGKFAKLAYYVSVTVVVLRILFFVAIALVVGVLSGVGPFITITLVISALALGAILNAEKMMNLSVKKRQL